MADQTGKIAAGAPLFTGDRVSFVDTENEGKGGGPRVFIGAPDYRVFLWGVEITADVFSVSIKNSLSENLSTCQINIVNDNEKYTCPSGLNRLRQRPNSEGFSVQPDEWSDADPSSLVLSNTGTNTQTEPVDTYKLAHLKIERFRKSKNRFLNVPIEKIIKDFPNGDIFPLVPGMPIIQAPDPIRVFLKNPWNLAPTSVGGEDTSEEWYYGFTGFVAACTEEFDGKTNRSILRVFCEEIRRFLRYMLTTTNTETVALDDPTGISPNLSSNNPNQQHQITDSPGFTRLISANQSIESNMSLPQAYKFVFFGDTTPADQNDQAQQTMNRISGVPGFSQERLKEVTLSLKRGELEKGMSAQLDEMYPQLSEEDVTSEGAKFDFDEQTLWIILPDPAGWSHKEARWPFTWGFRADYISEFRSRFDILDEFTKRIDAIWYSTPKGDVVLEFPQYDQIPMLHEEPWRSILQIQNEWVGFSLTDDDRNIRTLTLSPRSPISGLDLSKSAPYVAFGVQSDPVLQARYGYRVQNFPRPFAHDSTAAIGDEKAQASMLQALANSDSNRLEGLECLPNFRAPVARPIFFKYRNIIAFCTRIQHQIVWGQDARTIVELHYLRPFDPKRNDWVRLSQDYGWNWTGIKKEAVLNQDPIHGPDLAPEPSMIGTAQPANTANEVKNAPKGTYTESQRKRAESLVAAGNKALADGDTDRYRKINEKLDALVSDTRK